MCGNDVKLERGVGRKQDWHSGLALLSKTLALLCSAIHLVYWDIYPRKTIKSQTCIEGESKSLSSHSKTRIA
jgi:hypothetical protein